MSNAIIDLPAQSLKRQAQTERSCGGERDAQRAPLQSKPRGEGGELLINAPWPLHEPAEILNC